MYLKTKEHRSPHPRNRYQAGKHLIVPHRRSSVVNSNSINPRNDSYTYDTQGNRTGVTIPWGNTLTSTYDAANRQLSSGSRRYTYDANGNLITDTLGTEQTAYTYNGADRMTGVSANQPTVLADRYPDQATNAAYHYDALGRRVQEDYRRTQTTPGTGGRTNQRIDQGTQITFYDALGFNPIARSDYRGQTRSTIEANRTVSSQKRSFGNPSPKEVLTYAGNELILQTGLRIYQEDARTLVGFRDETYLHQDQLGSTILTTSASGEDIKTVHYDAFGQVLSPNASIATPGHTYNGKPRDPMTGLVNYGFRDYDPRQGRFTTVDPIRSGENWYGYVVNDPLNMIDRYGLEAEDASVSPPQSPPGVDVNYNILVARNMTFREWYNAVRNGSNWDYKQKGSQYEDFGNFNYGATGRAVGIPAQILKRGADWAQTRAGTSKKDWGKPLGSPPHGDDPADQEQIQRGIDYHDSLK